MASLSHKTPIIQTPELDLSSGVGDLSDTTNTTNTTEPSVATLIADDVPKDSQEPRAGTPKPLREMLKEDRTILWTQLRKVLRATLAQFVIAKGIKDNAATIQRLAPLATTMLSKKEPLGDISTRVYILQTQITSGKTGKEQEDELARLIASVIFSRKKDDATRLVREAKHLPIRVRQDEEQESVTNAAIRDMVDTGASMWLAQQVQEGMQALIDVKSGQAGLEWISRLNNSKTI